GQIEALGEQIRTISRLAMPTSPLSPAEERRWSPVALGPNLKAARDEIAVDLDRLKGDMIREIVNRTSLLVQADQGEVVAYLRALGGHYTSRTIVMSTVAGTIPVKMLGRLAQHAGICWIDYDNPGGPELNLQGTSLGLTT